MAIPRPAHLQPMVSPYLNTQVIANLDDQADTTNAALAAHAADTTDVHGINNLRRTQSRSTGIYIWEDFARADPVVLANASIDGSVQIYKWADLEPNAPVSGVHTYVWDDVDADLATIRDAGKKCSIGLIGGTARPTVPGFGLVQQTPGWAAAVGNPLHSGKAIAMFWADHAGGGIPPANKMAYSVDIPIPWDSYYLTNFAALYQALADHLHEVGLYDVVSAVKLTAPTISTEETRIPSQGSWVTNQLDDATVAASFTTPDANAVWAANGYTRTLAEDAWKQTAAAIAAAFPDKTLWNATIPTTGFPSINASGQIVDNTDAVVVANATATAQHTDTLTCEHLVAWAAAEYGDRFMYSHNSLDETYTAANQPMSVLAADLGGSVGFQLNAGDYGPNATTYPAGTVLETAIENGLGLSMRYLEVFRSTIGRYQQVLADAHTAFGPPPVRLPTDVNVADFINGGETDHGPAVQRAIDSLDRPVRATTSISASTNVFTSPAHGFTEGMAVKVRTLTGVVTDSPQIAVGDTLYAGAVTRDTYKLYRDAPQTDLVDVTNAGTAFAAAYLNLGGRLWFDQTITWLIQSRIYVDSTEPAYLLTIAGDSRTTIVVDAALGTVDTDMIVGTASYADSTARPEDAELLVGGLGFLAGTTISSVVVAQAVESAATSDIISLSDHGYVAGTVVRWRSVSLASTPTMDTSTAYYVGTVTTDSFKLYTTYADAIAQTNAVNITSTSGTGTFETQVVASSTWRAPGTTGSTGTQPDPASGVPTNLPLKPERYVIANSILRTTGKGDLRVADHPGVVLEGLRIILSETDHDNLLGFVWACGSALHSRDVKMERLWRLVKAKASPVAQSGSGYTDGMRFDNTKAISPPESAKANCYQTDRWGLHFSSSTVTNNEVSTTGSTNVAGNFLTKTHGMDTSTEYPIIFTRVDNGGVVGGITLTVGQLYYARATTTTRIEIATTEGGPALAFGVSSTVTKFIAGITTTSSVNSPVTASGADQTVITTGTVTTSGGAIVKTAHGLTVGTEYPIIFTALPGTGTTGSVGGITLTKNVTYWATPLTGGNNIAIRDTPTASGGVVLPFTATSNATTFIIPAIDYIVKTAHGLTVGDFYPIIFASIGAVGGNLATSTTYRKRYYAYALTADNIAIYNAVDLSRTTSADRTCTSTSNHCSFFFAWPNDDTDIGWVYEQKVSGDGLVAHSAKGGTGTPYFNLTNCNGASIDAAVGMSFRFTSSKGISIDSWHWDSNQLGGARSGLYTRDSQITLVDPWWHAGPAKGDPTVQQNWIIWDDTDTHDDTTPHKYGSQITVWGGAGSNRYDYTYNNAPGEDVRYPDVNFRRFNRSSRFTVRGLSYFNWRTGNSTNEGMHTHGAMFLGSYLDARTVEAIPTLNTALRAARSIIAGDFEVRCRGVDLWTIRPVGGVRNEIAAGGTPTITGAAVSTLGGTISTGVPYNYQVAVRNVDGSFGPGSAVATVAAPTTPSRSIDLTVNLQADGPQCAVLFRTRNATPSTAPTHWVELTFSGSERFLRDSGTAVDGLVWQTTSVPAPAAYAADFTWNGQVLPSGRRIAYLTAAPSSAQSGPWTQGDQVWNVGVSGVGSTPGWLCTASGSPGTWKALAPLV